MDEVSLQLPQPELELEQLLAQVPVGRVTTYGRLATALGAPVAARWVGHYMLHHEHGDHCVCHRVVRADGALGAYQGGTADDKARRLQNEGVSVQGAAGGRGRVDLGRYAQPSLASDLPLKRLISLQTELAGQARIEAEFAAPKFVAGVDVSYIAPKRGVAAYALVEVATGELLWSLVHEGPAPFPYISTLLSFRELPLLLPLIDRVRQAGHMADVVMVDGSGVLHHREAGIATHLGVLADVPTVGVTKKLLCGQFDARRLDDRRATPVLVDSRPLGTALLTGHSSRRPIFVSPGHRTDVPTATKAVEAVLRGHRLPEPVYWADRISRAAAQAAA